MTEKRFTYLNTNGWNKDGFLNTMNGLNEKNKKLQKENDQLKKDVKRYSLMINTNSDLNDEIYEQLKKTEKNYKSLLKENKQLKSTMKEVAKLLEEEVDLFSDKATKHDLNAYVELQELDNKDAYYMATSTKKAIKMLKELEE